MLCAGSSARIIGDNEYVFLLGEDHAIVLCHGRHEMGNPWELYGNQETLSLWLKARPSSAFLLLLKLWSF
jgi:hypothetical protein